MSIWFIVFLPLYRVLHSFRAELRVLGVIKDHKVIRVSKGLKVSKVSLDQQRLKVLKDHRPKDHKDLKEIRQKVSKVI